MNDIELIYNELKLYFEKYNFFKNNVLNVQLENYSNSLSAFVSSINDFYKYNDYFYSLLRLHAFLYKVYSKDNKILQYPILSKKEFIDFFVPKFGTSIESKIEKYWEYDPNTETFRKEGKNIRAKKGLFLNNKETNNQGEVNPITLKNFIWNFTEEGYLSNYLWIYGENYRTIGVTSRFYFNFLPEQDKVFNFISAVKDNLNEAQIPFSLKFLADPNLYKDKSDVCVLYVGRHHTLQTLMVLTRIYKQFKEKLFFVEKKPLFSAKVVEGISFGEDPDDERFESFGSYRCAYITIAVFNLRILKRVINFNACQLKDEIDEIQNLTKEIPLPKLKNSLKPWTDRFHVNKYSKYTYDNELYYISRNIGNQPFTFQINHHNRKEIYFKAALKITFKLTSNAIWYESEIQSKRNQYLECNWASFSKQTFMNNEAQMLKEIEYKILDTSFENGKLGVSFFLKKMYDLNKEYYREFDTAFYRATKKQIFRKEKNLSDIEKWFVYNTNYHYFRDRHKLQSIIPSVISIQRKNNLKNLNLIKFLDLIISQDQGLVTLINQNSELVEQFENLLKLFLVEDKPFEEISQTKEFKADLNLGLAYIGYVCLRLYNTTKYPSLPLSFNYSD